MEEELYQFRTQPFDHQRRIWEESRTLENYAAFWEQGTGKSKFTIDTLGSMYTEKIIDSAVIVAPNGVHMNWITDELPTHLPESIPLHAFAYQSDKASTKKHQTALGSLLSSKGFPFLAISYDGWMTDAGKRAVWALMKHRRVFLALDESHRIKTPTAARTRSILAGGKHAAVRRILSGTPITQGPFDLYSQIAFLDKDFWRRELNIASYTAFKSYFGVWDKGYNRAAGREYDVLVCYQNLEELGQVIKRISSRVVKEDVLDLPPKLYTKRYYEMTPAQRRIYEDLDTEFMAFLEDGGMISTPLAITRMLRMQQVLCGYVPVDGDQEPTELIDRNNNPRLKLLKDTMEDVTGKSIIWAMWTKDIDMIMEMLQSIGRKPVRYDGTLGSDDKERAKAAFKNGDATDFVANSQMSEGLTLNVAKTTIYYNNSYKLIDRKQTEDRNHRIGQTDQVLYIDLVCPGTRDEDAIANLVSKHEVATTILGDRKGEWL